MRNRLLRAVYPVQIRPPQSAEVGSVEARIRHGVERLLGSGSGEPPNNPARTRLEPNNPGPRRGVSFQSTQRGSISAGVDSGSVRRPHRPVGAGAHSAPNGPANCTTDDPSPTADRWQGKAAA